MASFEGSGQRPLAQASVKGKVKWFNATKGYGFITLDNGGDAFCHASALQAHGTPNLAPGTTIICDLQDSPRGLQVVTVHSIDASTAEMSLWSPRKIARSPRPKAAACLSISGRNGPSPTSRNSTFGMFL